MRLAVPALLVAASLPLAVTFAATPRPLGPGAVVQMHRELFAALDAGDAAAVQAFLSADLDMDEEYLKRPCIVWRETPDGKDLAGANRAESAKLVGAWAEEAEAAGGTFSTELTPLTADCHSAELSTCVLDVVRAHTRDGETKRTRYRSTSIVTYADGGWKLTHWHLSRVE